MPKRDDTFILYYWEDYEQYTQDNPSCLYCLSESTINIILSALRFSTWKTRWRLNRADNNRAITDAELWDKIDALAALAQKEVIEDMSCDLSALGESIAGAIVEASNATAMEHVAQALLALANKPCCDSSVNVTVNGGVVSEWTDGEGINHPIYGTQPPATNDGETPPDGLVIPPGTRPIGLGHYAYARPGALALFWLLLLVSVLYPVPYQGDCKRGH